MRVIELKETVTASNDRDAEALREELNLRGILLVNLMSGPGAGKTTLLSRTIRDLPDLRIAVLEADLDATVDAETIEALGARAIQAHTDGMCHMDAGMTRAGLEALGTEQTDLVFLENVGNLICPAEFDTGAQRRVMILSIPEGDDKPLKYPLMFRESDALILSKLDALPYFDFSVEKCIERAKKLNPEIKIFPLSAKTGEGMAAWEAWLRESLPKKPATEKEKKNA